MATTPSVRAQILLGLADRLLTCTAANGYSHTIKGVLGVDQRVDMGQEFADEALPAVIVIDEAEDPKPEMQTRDAAWAIRLQLVNTDVPDTDMLELVNSVGRCIMANDPTAERVDGWRSIHPRIYGIQFGRIEGDLGLVRANRIYTLQVILSHRLKAWEF